MNLTTKEIKMVEQLRNREAVAHRMRYLTLAAGLLNWVAAAIIAILFEHLPSAAPQMNFTGMS